MTIAVEEKSFIGRRLSGHVLKISMALKRYNPEDYDVRVLVTKEEEWTDEVRHAVSSLIDHAGDILSGDITDEEIDAVHEIVETQNDLYKEFLTKFHHKMHGVTTAAAGDDVITTAGGDCIVTELNAPDCIIANHGTAAKYDLLVPDILSDGDTADKCSWETLVTVDGAEHVSVCGDTEDMTELVLGQVPSNSDPKPDVNDFYQILGRQFTDKSGMEVTCNLVLEVQMLVLIHVPVITLICSVFTLSGYCVQVPVFTMTQSGVKAGVDSGGYLMSVT